MRWAARRPPIVVKRTQVLLAAADELDVIRLHRLGHPEEEFHLNPDLIAWVEATPDTVVTLTTHTKLIVAERPEEVVAAVRAWRASILEAGLPRRTRLGAEGAGLAVVRATAGESGQGRPEGGR